MWGWNQLNRQGMSVNMRNAPECVQQLAPQHDQRRAWLSNQWSHHTLLVLRAVYIRYNYIHITYIYATIFIHVEYLHSFSKKLPNKKNYFSRSYYFRCLTLSCNIRLEFIFSYFSWVWDLRNASRFWKHTTQMVLPPLLQRWLWLHPFQVHGRAIMHERTQMRESESFAS